MYRGTGSHNWQVIIGYSSDMDDEEKNTFIDFTMIKNYYEKKGKMIERNKKPQKN